MINRRHFLKGSCAGLGVASGFAANLSTFNAYAADVQDYKALVCIFLYGAMDCHDTVIPYDQSSYNDYEFIREPLLARMDNSLTASSRRRNALLPLNGAGGDVGGRRFAFPAEFSSLYDLYNQSNLAVIGNVGPLIEPTTRTAFRNNSAKLPPKLFSHNDQQSVWMASQPEGARTGWGGRFADIVQAAKANSSAAFTTVSATGSTIFLTGEDVQPFYVSVNGAADVKNLDDDYVLGSREFSRIYQDVLRDSGGTRSSLFKRDIVNITNGSLDNNAVLQEQLALPVDPMVVFPESRLSQQLNIVARLIARRNSLGVKRQVFFVSAGGFDTHSDQAETLPFLQADIASAMSAFYASLVEMGAENSVTTFTASDFGRTLGVNGDGTDHGWGAHHLVMGGAVNGQQILGNIPEPAFEHEQDAGRGRLIPQLSVDQYAAALGKWYGLNDSELLDALPGLGNFDTGALSTLFV